MVTSTTRRSTSSTRATRRSSTSTRTATTARKGYGKARPRHVQPVPPAPDTLALGKFQLDTANKGNGLSLLLQMPADGVKVVFFDPQYPGGVKNWKVQRKRKSSAMKRRAELAQMSEETITKFFGELSRVVAPSGYVFLWVDNYHARNGITHWLTNTDFVVVDKIVWAKGMATVEDGVVSGSGKMGMGARARRSSEELFVLQKTPTRAKDSWKRKNIRDVWMEKVDAKSHIHAKPMELQKALIEATTDPGDLVLDPCSGSFSVMDAAHAMGRRFIGCDLAGAKRRPQTAVEPEPEKAKRVAKKAGAKAQPAATAKRVAAPKRRAKAKPASSKPVAEQVASKPAARKRVTTKVAPKPTTTKHTTSKTAPKVARASDPKRVAKVARKTKPARKVARKWSQVCERPRDLLAGGMFALVLMPTDVLNLLATNEELLASQATKGSRDHRAPSWTRKLLA